MWSPRAHVQQSLAVPAKLAALKESIAEQAAAPAEKDAACREHRNERDRNRKRATQKIA